MNREEILIETLRGRLKGFAEISELLDGVSMYDDRGYVKFELLTSLLEFCAETQKVVEKVMHDAGTLLGVDWNAEKVNKRGKAKEGADWSVKEILKHCTLEDNVMRLPQVPFAKKSYDEVKKWILEAGGQWQGGKTNGFVFDFDARRVFEVLHSGKRCNLAQEFQYFATPKGLADELAAELLPIERGMSILEPSAGRGALIEAVHDVCYDVVVDYCEAMPENREFLGRLENVRYVGDYFLTISGKYDRIIANPPFARNQDVMHIWQMYRLLKVGGVMAVIASRHWQMGTEKVCVDFRKWLGDVDARVMTIDEGVFKESGTGIGTTMIVIEKDCNVLIPGDKAAVELSLFG